MSALFEVPAGFDGILGFLLCSVEMFQDFMHIMLVRTSALWACQTWPCTEYVLKAANSMQVLDVVGMMYPKRSTTEPGLEWHKKTLRRAWAAIYQCSMERWSTFIPPKPYFKPSTLNPKPSWAM